MPLFLIQAFTIFFWKYLQLLHSFNFSFFFICVKCVKYCINYYMGLYSQTCKCAHARARTHSQTNPTRITFMIILYVSQHISMFTCTCTKQFVYKNNEKTVSHTSGEIRVVNFGMLKMWNSLGRICFKFMCTYPKESWFNIVILTMLTHKRKSVTYVTEKGKNREKKLEAMVKISTYQ